jgi:hypothetical protein
MRRVDKRIAWTLPLPIDARYLVGMRCPSCSEFGCYVGLQWVHCQNEACYHYDIKYVQKLRTESHKSSVDKLLQRDNFLVLPDEGED